MKIFVMDSSFKLFKEKKWIIKSERERERKRRKIDKCNDRTLQIQTYLSVAVAELN